MTTADGSILGATKIVDHGPESSLWNLAVLGDGYQASEMSKYHTDVAAFVTALQNTAPYQGSWNSINVFRVDVSSTDSGADDPVTCGGTGATVRTYFDATFCGDGQIQRLLVCDSATVHSVVGSYVPTAHATIVIVNSSVYGGSESDGYGTLSTAPQATEIGLHELGHTFGLADEYACWSACGSGELGHDHFTGAEPVQPNVTANTDRATLKWRLFVDAATALPTTSNANCSDCDPQASPVAAGTVGLFEGAYYNHCGVYRPEYDCRMRALYHPYCTVCSFAIAIALASINCTITAASSGAVPPEELDAIRLFRDNQMASRAIGRRWIGLVERHGAEVAGHLAVDKGLRTESAALLQRLVQIVQSSHNTNPEVFDPDIVQRVDQLLGRLVSRASPELRADAESARLDLQAVAGRTAIQALEISPTT